MWVLGTVIVFWLIWSAIVLIAPLMAIGALLWVANRSLNAMAAKQTRDITPYDR